MKEVIVPALAGFLVAQIALLFFRNLKNEQRIKVMREQMSQAYKLVMGLEYHWLRTNLISHLKLPKDRELLANLIAENIEKIYSPLSAWSAWRPIKSSLTKNQLTHPEKLRFTEEMNRLVQECDDSHIKNLWETSGIQGANEIINYILVESVRKMIESTKPPQEIGHGASHSSVYRASCDRSNTKKEGWVRAIDEEMVCAHLGVASANDSYETAKRKLAILIAWHVQVATDPAVNGGYQLVKISDQSPNDPSSDADHMRYTTLGGYIHSEQPNDLVFVQGLNVGDEYTLKANGKQKEHFKVIKTPDETCCEYVVERIEQMS